jgi:hypothetical protein
MKIETYEKSQLGLLTVLPLAVAAFFFRIQPLFFASLILTLVGVPTLLVAGGENALRQSKSLIGITILSLAWLASGAWLAIFLFFKFVVFGPGTTLAH